MSGGKEKEEPSYATFKGLGYVSMVGGVPLFPLLILVGLACFGGLLLMLMVGAWALLWPFFCFAILLTLRVMCENDNKALERFKWRFKAWIVRLRFGSLNLMVSPNHTRSKYEHVRTALKKIYRSR